MILLDANILLETIITGRDHKSEVLEWMSKVREELCINMLTVHLILHFGLKDKMTLANIRQILADYPITSLLQEDYVSAMELMRNSDHEDALQLATAERIGCSHIATLDRNFSNTYADRFSFVNPLKS